ncbi:hypothetical protein ACJMK2_021752 [Sinanodonta woodiana]|uniref:K Homology domain-containing protein n=1 Tax=Sinanodonta woodiana TaxID=1069815 RepID=A0ABD3TIZ9_SINWO
MATEQKMVQGNENTPMAPPSILTVRMIMQGKEVGSIIGKKGDNIKKYREDSGAKINISDGSCPERIVTITGTIDTIHKAFTMICQKFEEDLQNTPTVPKPPITLRLVVPASQCGSLIGKGGSKIKEIRESTGASIQVASEMLPNSTERAVTISGTAEAVTQCIRNVSGIMLDSPPKGATIPYRPKPTVPPVVFTAGGQAYTLPAGQIAMPAAPELNFPKDYWTSAKLGMQIYTDETLNENDLQRSMTSFTGAMSPEYPSSRFWYLQPNFNKLSKLHQLSIGQPLSLVHPTYLPVSAPPGYAPAPIQFQRPATAPVSNGPQMHEMTIPNDLIGCIIGRGGQKINEIRQLSGATIKISNAEEGSSDRKVTITGSLETIGIAQYLINTRITTEVCGMGIR